ncbi:SDR family NAD(P)-dependent oxidoreductase [Actinomadura sp. 9N407]|uniref:SDR family NAD(P)-dependent oxidoreductase n=1 Tax=Actinomadura sp. 9N407 TaxID=3375154 RepID=UPI0037BBB13F
MKIDLSGKKAVVTGAGQGIGLACVRAFTEAGADVLGGARTVGPELLEATPYTLEVDLATPDGPGRLIEHARRHFGGIDVLVNNVGGGVRLAAGFLDTEDATWAETLELNLLSTVRATRAALPSLVERQGAIVNIGSTNATLADPRLSHYSAAKAAVVNLGKALSLEFSPQGVGVNTISPGPVRTRLWSRSEIAAKMRLSEEEALAEIPKMMGLTTGKMIEPAEVAALAVLLGSKAVPSVTGVEYLIEGGMIKSV